MGGFVYAPNPPFCYVGLSRTTLSQPIPFGKYYLLERVNVGGMAEVFKAKATGVEGFERLVAVKRILPSIAEDEEFITMFIDEAKIAVQLTHPNVAQIFDLGKVDDSYFIALEYVRGKDMRAVFNRGRQNHEPVPVPMACYVMMKVCEGLDYAHNKRDAAGQFLNLVHRDVSPQNLLVSYDGEVKIIDFGIAKAAGKVGKTQAGILKGKFGYMSPEQVQGLEIDRRSDIFGLGICLYETLTGERLFVAETDFATLEKVRNVEIMPPSTYNRRIPEELEQIVLRALARDPDQRPQTAMELHDELQSFMYTSGSFFGRKDLSAFMRRMFAEGIARENARDREYAQLELPDETTGLHRFDELDPVSAVSDISDLPATEPAGPESLAGPSGGEPPALAAPDPIPSRRPNKSTLLGMPQVVQGSLQPPASPPPPFQQSPSAPPPGGSASGQAPGGHAAHPAAATDLDMGWDDEELSTQIYDRPEDLAEAMSGVMPNASAPASSTGSLPPAEPVSARPRSYAPGSLPPSFPPGFHPPGSQVTAEGNGAFPPAPTTNAARPSPPHGRGASWEPGSLPPVEGGSLPPQTGGSLPPSQTSAPPAYPAGPRPMGNPSPFDSAPHFPQVAPVSPFGSDAFEDPVERPPRVVFAILSVLAIVGLIVGGLAIFRPAQPGVIHLRTTPPDATVSLDGMAVEGSSPFVLQDIVPDQQHEIWVDRTGFHRWSSKVKLQAGQTMVLPPVNLKAFESGFSLDSVPSGAQVTLDGRLLEQRTPVRLPNLAPGNHTVQLDKEGYLPWEIPSLRVTEGTVLELPRAVLTPGQPYESETGAKGRRGEVRRRQAVGPRTGRAEGRPSGRRDEQRPNLPIGQPAPAAEAPAPAPVAPPPPTPSEQAQQEVPSGVGTLRVNTRPWSIVFVDDELVGNTPQMNIELSAGRHSVTLVNEDFGIRKNIQVVIKPGETVTRVLTLSP